MKMNDILKERLDKLDSLEKFSCWYLVKQPTTFFKLCYLVSFLDEYQKTHCTEQFQQYISEKIAELNARKSLDISDNYRALLVAAYFGLIQKTAAKGSTYENSKITDTYTEIKKRCNGEFEKTELYADIIERQIEKIYLSTAIDDQYEGIRANYKLYPVMFLYKILIEIGRNTGEYSITLNEYEYLVETTENYEDYLQTLFYIKLYRENTEIDSQFVKKLGTKFDNRFKQAIKQLPTLIFEDNKIYLNPKYLNEITKKLFYFDKKSKKANLGIYFDFLGSTKPLIEFNEEEDNMPETKPFTELNYKPLSKEKKYHAYNRIIFGAPGTGKSFQLKQESTDGNHFANIERVTFHPDYSYGQFVGSYKPVSDDDGRIRYEYVPGPFMRTLIKALESGKKGESAEKFLLIVEEINRAKVAAIFGDMFQLLDRTDAGDSVYEIQASEDVRRYLARELGGTKENYTSIKIPNNMYIWATMNSADQGVFPMDTAFKRRWEFTYIGINENDDKISIDNLPVKNSEGNEIEWNILRKSINNMLLKECKVNEDKLLGPFFISGEVFKNATSNTDEFFNAFNSKVLMYLFEDAGKMHQKKLFAGIDQNELTFSKVCEDFKTRGTAIFGNSFQLVKE